MKQQKLHKTTIHRSLIRPLLIMGGEREVTLFVMLISGVLIITYDRYAMLLAVILWVVGVWAAREMAKNDAQMMQILIRYFKYSKIYTGISKMDINLKPINPEFSNLLPYGSIIEDGVILNKDGSLSSAFYYNGKDVDSSSLAERNGISLQVKDAINKLGTGWMIQTDLIRVESNYYPPHNDSHFDDKISWLIEEERRNKFNQEGLHYQTVNVLIITYIPPKNIKSSIFDIFIVDDKKYIKSRAAKHLGLFTEHVKSFTSQLSNQLNLVQLKSKKVVDEEGQEHRSDDFVQYINFLLTGNNFKFQIPRTPFYLDTLLSHHEFKTGLTPKLDNNYISVISITGFPLESTPNILRSLDVTPMTYRMHNRYIARDQYEAVKIARSYQGKWEQKMRGFVDQITGNKEGRVNSDAYQMAQDADAVSAEIESGLVSYGYYSSSIVLQHPNVEELEDNARYIVKKLQNIGFDARIETVNCVDAFLGTLPSENMKNVRQPIINTLNLAHLIPLASIWAGRKYNPCEYYPLNSPPLMYTATTGNTPFRLNTHSGDVGHFMILGPTGAGKSTLASMMQAQFRRYKNNKMFVFDKGNSAQPICLATGGKHYEIGGDGETLEFYPLGNLDGSKTDFLFCVEFIETLVILQGEVISVEDRVDITSTLKLLKNENYQQPKTITDFRNTISNKKVRSALAYYDHDGAFPLLSGEESSLEFSGMTVFEMSEIMEMGEKALLPTLLYIFHEIKKSLDGSPAYIHIAEAWTFFAHPVFRDKLVSFLKELRKLNCIVGLDTQSLADARDSGILPILIESCPTKIYLGNPEAFSEGTASEPGVYETYKSFGLNDTQIGIIRNCIQKRDYYITHPEGNRLFSMGLGEVALSFVGATGKQDLKDIKKTKEEHGDNWPYAWMDSRGVNYQKYFNKGDNNAEY